MKDDVSSYASLSGSGETAEADRSLADDLRQLAEDGKSFAAAEAAYQKARVAYAAGQVRGLAIRGALAAALAFFALMALTFGLVLGLSPLLTVWGATAVVFGAMLLLALLFAASASAKWRGMVRMLGQGETGE